MKKEIKAFTIILIATILYGIGTVFFIFPNSVLLGGTSGISIILSAWISFSPGTIISVINVALIVLAFFVLGKDMAVKSFIGSILTTVFISGIEILFPPEAPIVSNNFLAAFIGAAIIAIASAMLFFVGSSSGGTDIIALIVQKYAKINIGKALIISDILIVIIGGILSGLSIAFSSILGFLIKTLGIDLVIYIIRKICIRIHNKKSNHKEKSYEFTR